MYINYIIMQDFNLGELKLNEKRKKEKRKKMSLFLLLYIVVIIKGTLLRRLNFSCAQRRLNEHDPH